MRDNNPTCLETIGMALYSLLVLLFLVWLFFSPSGALLLLRIS